MTNNTSSYAASPVPAGPAEKYDLNINEESFPIIRELVQDYPDICRIHPKSRSRDSYLLNHPEAVKRVLIDNHKNYVKGVGFERVKLLLGNGIIVSNGEFWKQQRRMVQPAFHREMLKQLTAMMQQVTQNLLSRWEKAAAEGQTVNVSTAMSAFGLEIILRGLFSKDLDRLIDEHGGNPFSIFTDDSARDLSLAVKFRALIKLMQGVIDRRREHRPAAFDMLAALMAARDLQGRPMSDKALIDEIMTLIVAGHETSAVNLTWMWHLLGQNPAVEERLHAEVDGLPYELSPDFSDLQNINYAKQVMFETMRLYPPVWLFSRKALQDDRVPGGDIPAGSDIFISPFFLHRRADYWPDPEHFAPERFTEAETARRHRTAYIPFSAGPRKCIGDVFSAVEMQIHFGTIARRLRLRPVPEQKIELEPAINLRCKHNIIMIPELR